MAESPERKDLGRPERERETEPEPESDTSDAATPLALFLCVTAVWICWASHDYLQERVFKFQGFRFGFFMAFVLQTCSFLLALLQRVMTAMFVSSPPQSRHNRRRTELQRVDEERAMLDDDDESSADAASASQWALLGHYLLLSSLIAGANGMATAALNYVNMQMKVLFKSSKIVTVMLLGTLLFRKRYLLVEYSYMLLTCGGLVIFFLATSSAALESSLIGAALLVAAVLTDSMLPNVQQRLLQDLRRPKAEVVYHTNWISALLTLAYISFTGELGAAIAFLRLRRRVAMLLLLQSTAGYFGILAYLETVRRFGSKVTTIVTSCRKLFTIALSSVLFGHPLNGYHAAGVFAVFLGVLLNANAGRCCSRTLVVPALCLVAGLMLSQVMPADPPADGPWAWLSWLTALRDLASVRLLN